jgi:prostaglandin reductase 2
MDFRPFILHLLQRAIEEKKIERERFLVLAYREKFAQALQDMKSLYSEGKVRIAVTVADGLENAGPAFVSMMNGGNIGKQLVRVADLQY